MAPGRLQQLAAHHDGCDLPPLLAGAGTRRHTVFNQEQVEHGQDLLSIGEYIVSADFWNRTLQNWQSEFLAVGSMVALSIVLRQRGSAESKPVGTPHHEGAVTAE